MIILGIESSCDETAAAILEVEKSQNYPKVKILSNIVASQIEIHAKYGGVVPEIASRKHLESIIPVVTACLDKADTSLDKIDGIATTYAPGLLGSLLIGLSFAKGIALSLKKPFIGVNHLEGHLNAIHLENQNIIYPHVGLVVSGGHTSLYYVKEFGEYKLLGSTRDDAAGEAFDKVAKLLKLGYPGGPIIDKIAPKGNPKAFKFKNPQFGGYSAKKVISTFDFSFSGIKTAVLLEHKKALEQNKVDENFIYDLVASFQFSAVNFLCTRIIEAVQKTNSKAVVISGGVAANKELRETLSKKCMDAKISCFIPKVQFCTDNAAMIAYVGARYLEIGKSSDLNLNAIANLEIGIS